MIEVSRPTGWRHPPHPHAGKGSFDGQDPRPEDVRLHGHRPGLEAPRRLRDLRRQELGQRLLRHQQARPPHRPPGQKPRPVHRPQGTRRPALHPRHPAADSPAVHRHPQAPDRRDRRGLPQGHDRIRVLRRVLLRLPIKVNQQRHVVEEVLHFGKPHGFGSRPGASRNCSPCWPSPTATATSRSSATGSRTTSSSRWWLMARKIGKNIIPVVEKFTELELIVKHMEEIGVRQPVGVRVKLASRGTGRWARVRRLPVQIRSHPHRGAGGVRVPEEPGARRLPPDDALPHGLAGVQHPQGEGRPDRGHPGVHRAVPARRRAEVPSTSAAGSGSITTGPRPTSRAASTTPSRSTPTT